jgi:hypothetical protein
MTTITTTRPVAERSGARYAVVGFLVAGALGVGVAGGFALDDESSVPLRSAPSTESQSASEDRPAFSGSPDSLDRRAQSESNVSTDNGCRLPGGRMPC